jgi:hypothetical protein
VSAAYSRSSDLLFFACVGSFTWGDSIALAWARRIGQWVKQGI